MDTIRLSSGETLVDARLIGACQAYELTYEHTEADHCEFFSEFESCD